jgi:hypothetical protein
MKGENGVLPVPWLSILAWPPPKTLVPVFAPKPVFVALPNRPPPPEAPEPNAGLLVLLPKMLLPVFPPPKGVEVVFAEPNPPKPVDPVVAVVVPNRPPPLVVVVLPKAGALAPKGVVPLEPKPEPIFSRRR